MSKKKKPANRTGHPARRSHLNLVGSPSTADTALLLKFTTWYRKHAVEYDEHPEPDAFKILAGVLFQLAADRGLSLSHPTVDVLDTVLGMVADDEELSELEGPALDVFMHFLEFLNETDAWRGTDEEFDESIQFIGTLLDDSLDDENEPEAILDELLEGLEAIPNVPIESGTSDPVANTRRETAQNTWSDRPPASS
ncbi:hypothetical protein [Mycetocola zhadangensis]|uniref:Uncharacterized protein n=1 Tax=Mycetocola zhadangensis TaxID=1164595 RepID=A0A3L7J0T7_9MICO|nr:hypothetical protein [Mycetocola zhadangensis]RLQ84116.1 hypothetical protein D9V28_07740 [Mycetocola zhadangensis]GGE96011.1 hypothetical protein GCM10011313_18720 [Mycetocola zhadangensis]